MKHLTTVLLTSSLLLIGAGCGSKTDAAAEARLRAQAEYDAKQAQDASAPTPATAPVVVAPQTTSPDGTYCYQNFHCRRFSFSALSVVQLTSGAAGSQRFEMGTHTLIKKNDKEFTYTGLAGAKFGVKILNATTLEITEYDASGAADLTHEWKRQ